MTSFPDSSVDRSKESLVSRTIEIGGRSKFELLDDLKRASISLNDFAIQLLESEYFPATTESRTVNTIELTVHRLGYASGATPRQIVDTATEMGLVSCPIELGPYMRLQYLDQPEGAHGVPPQTGQAPCGSITLMSESLTDDDEFPKGFYLRRIDGVLWLRGYRSGPEHIWNPDDHLVFISL
ncbi:helicase [Gimesia sp.]|uniref:helicase n=1 Tax=Gimesia sp. TaxID=2024833 RepID=UPI003A8DF9B5